MAEIPTVVGDTRLAYMPAVFWLRQAMFELSTSKMRLRDVCQRGMSQNGTMQDKAIVIPWQPLAEKFSV